MSSTLIIQRSIRRSRRLSAGGWVFRAPRTTIVGLPRPLVWQWFSRLPLLALNLAIQKARPKIIPLQITLYEAVSCRLPVRPQPRGILVRIRVLKRIILIRPW